jgi:hypothetical protein
MVGVLSYADERGLIEPEYEITLDPTPSRPRPERYTGLNAWRREAAVSRPLVVASVKRAVDSGLLRAATEEDRLCLFNAGSCLRCRSWAARSASLIRVKSAVKPGVKVSAA